MRPALLFFLWKARHARKQNILKQKYAAICIQKATFGAGCFWGVEAAFGKVDGVTDSAVGYMGGATRNPTYRQVCSGSTGHVEACQVTFDQNKISFKELLEIFWNVHDPTQHNRQGPDIGTQYRSVIFYHTDQQKKEAIESKTHLDKIKRYDKKIMTKIEKATTFYKAEEYHQKYLEKKQSSLLGQLMDELKKS